MILTLQFYLKKEFHVYVPVHSSQLLGEIDPVVQLSLNKIQQSTFGEGKNRVSLPVHTKRG